MAIYKLAYLAFSGVLFFLASYPLMDEFRNEESFFFTLKELLKKKKRGSTVLALMFANLMLATSLFVFFSNVE